MAVKHTSEIKFQIGLDENRVPEEISWTAKEGGIEDMTSKAIMLSVWDPKDKDTLRMDLWTKDMPGLKKGDKCVISDGGKTYTTFNAPHGDHHDLWIAPRA